MHGFENLNNKYQREHFEIRKKKIETTKQLQKKDFMATISQVVQISSERFIYWMLKIIVVRINDDDYDESDDDADDNA